MSQTAEYIVDKSTWGDGPWQSEPDRVEFRHAGMACLMLRHPDGGNWCGYVGVPPGHQLHGCDMCHPGVQEIEAHHGINYARACAGIICHTPAPGEPEDVWWLGCDFGHAFDFAPGSAAARHPEMGPTFRRMQTYCDARFVRHVVERMAEQLAEVTKAG